MRKIKLGLPLKTMIFSILVTFGYFIVPKIKLVRPLQTMFSGIMISGYFLLPLSWISLIHKYNLLYLSVILSIFIGKAVAKEKEVSILTGISIILISVVVTFAIAILARGK